MLKKGEKRVGLVSLPPPRLRSQHVTAAGNAHPGGAELSHAVRIPPNTQQASEHLSSPL